MFLTESFCIWSMLLLSAFIWFHWTYLKKWQLPEQNLSTTGKKTIVLTNGPLVRWMNGLRQQKKGHQTSKPGWQIYSCSFWLIARRKQRLRTDCIKHWCKGRRCCDRVSNWSMSSEKTSWVESRWSTQSFKKEGLDALYLALDRAHWVPGVLPRAPVYQASLG